MSRKKLKAVALTTKEVTAPKKSRAIDMDRDVSEFMRTMLIESYPGFEVTGTKVDGKCKISQILNLQNINYPSS